AGLEPYVNLAWQNTALNSFEESGQLFSLRARKSGADNFRSNLGLRARVQLSDKVSLNGSLGWEHSYGAVRPETIVAFSDSGGFFKTQGAAADRNAVTPEVGLTVNLTESAALQAVYNGSVGKHSRSHAGTAVFSCSW
ncbi:MAG: autotransporter outer membrane beta-barrel domain-containing protein, partial [Deltaproteobacteria bacterium]|nr:autotransporter outer membrane beta-barrel domain-containing protein [Deltaproteobacteria bacterium]